VIGRAKRLVPRSVVAALRDCAGLSPRATLTYLRLRLARSVGARADDVRANETSSLLFVCHGNIMRSPFAEHLARARLDGNPRRFVVRSAGTDARADRTADPRALAVAPRYGISLETHRAQPLSSELVDGSDLICVMDHRNEAQVIARYPRASRKTILLGGIEADREQPVAIPDPYTMEGDDVSRVYERLSSAVEALARRLGARF
jgi:low molecular weight protein-tyrosine phosphatase